MYETKREKKNQTKPSKGNKKAKLKAI